MTLGRKTGGRTKGTPNKATQARNWKLSEALAKSNVDLGVEIANSIKTRDVDMLKALSLLLPYLSPRLAPVEAPQHQEETPDLLPDDEAQLIALVKNDKSP